MDTTDLQSLREDLNNLKDTVAEFVSQAGTDASKNCPRRDVECCVSVGNATSNVAEKARRLPLLLPSKLRLLPPSSRPSDVTIRSVQWLLR